jgi:hypothetical protein
VRNSTLVLLYSTWWRTQLITLLEDIHDDMDLCKNLLSSSYVNCKKTFFMKEFILKTSNI